MCKNSEEIYQHIGSDGLSVVEITDYFYFCICIFYILKNFYIGISKVIDLKNTGTA